MASTFSKIRDEFEGDLEAQVASLKKELSALKKAAAKRGASAYQDTREGAADVYDDLWQRFNDAMPEIRKQARVVNDKARENPVATVVAVGVLGLLVSLLVRR